MKPRVWRSRELFNPPWVGGYAWVAQNSCGYITYHDTWEDAMKALKAVAR